MKKIEQPTKDQVRAARLAAGQTQGEAAAMVYLSTNQRWHEYEVGDRNIDIARWELYLLLTNQHPNLKATTRKTHKHLEWPEPNIAPRRERRRAVPEQDAEHSPAEAQPC